MPCPPGVCDVIRTVTTSRRPVADRWLKFASPTHNMMVRSGALPKNFRALRFAPQASNACAFQAPPAARSGRVQTSHDAHTSALTSMSTSALANIGAFWCLSVVWSAYKRANHAATRGRFWKAVSVAERGLCGPEGGVNTLRSFERISNGPGDTSCPPSYRRENLPNGCISRPEPSGDGGAPASAPRGSGRRTPAQSGTRPRTSNRGPVLTVTAHTNTPSGPRPQNANAAAIPCQGSRRTNIAPRGLEEGPPARRLPNPNLGGRSVLSTVPAVSKQGSADRMQSRLGTAGQVIA